MIVQLAIGLMLLFPTRVFAFEEPKDFRGLAWGISREAAEATIHDQGEKRRQAGEIVIFADVKKRFETKRVWVMFYEEYIGGIKTLIILRFLDDKLGQVSLSFLSKDFSSMLRAFETRYGKPTKTNSKDFTSGLGARITGQELNWDGKKTMIHLSQYATSSKDSSAHITTIEHMKYMLAQERAGNAKRAGDL
jgi:hypothetical protein